MGLPKVSGEEEEGRRESNRPVLCLFVLFFLTIFAYHVLSAQPCFAPSPSRHSLYHLIFGRNLPGWIVEKTLLLPNVRGQGEKIRRLSHFLIMSREGQHGRSPVVMLIEGGKKIQG